MDLKFNYSFLLRLLGFHVGKKTKVYTLKIKRTSFIGNDNLISKFVEIGPNCSFDDNVKISKNSIISENTLLNKNVIVGRNVILQNIEVGENSHIEYEVITIGLGNGKIKIGKESYIGVRCVLDYSDNITIGDYVHIAGPSTGLWTHSSAEQVLRGDKLTDKTHRTTSPIVIENNVYIGGNCTIYPGVKIGHHSVIAPNSAVTKDVEPYSLVGGVPARFIKKVVSPVE